MHGFELESQSESSICFSLHLYLCGSKLSTRAICNLYDNSVSLCSYEYYYLLFITGLWSSVLGDSESILN